MPTQTFYNLPEEKRRRVLEAAIDEFASVRYTDASINRIVKAAGISRGSFYQYFEDKKDVYLYVMLHIGSQKMDIFDTFRGRDADLGFFEAVRLSVPVIFEWVDRNPRYNLIALRMLEDDSEFIRDLTVGMTSSLGVLVGTLEKDRALGRIRPDADLDMAMELYINVAITLMKKYYASPDTRATMLQKIDSAMDIICNGISAKREEVRDAAAGGT